MIDFDNVKQNAKGRWVSIFRALGIDCREDGKHGPCPVCGGDDRFRMDDKDGRGTWYCSQCEKQSGDGISLVQGVLGVDFKEAMTAVAGVVGGCEKNAVPREKPKMTKEKLREMFSESARVTENDLVGAYLKGRGLSLFPSTLWHSPKCWEPETKANVNAMLAVFSMPDTSVACLHRTFINKLGKMDINSPKKLTPTCVNNISGGAIRLFDPDDGTIAIAEGIETAIAVTEYIGIPCWSVVSSEIMKTFEPPEGINTIVICGDNDKNFAGQAAAYHLGKRLITKKYNATVMIPEKTGTDFLDELNVANRRKNV